MQSQRRLMIASALLHLALLAVLLYVRPLHVQPTRYPGTEHGTKISLTYSPGGAPKPVPPPITKVNSRLKQAPILVAPPSVDRASAQGGDARGAGNVTVALATFFPNPKPDLTQLPHGTRGDVIIDVVIDEQGKIVKTQIAQSMGHAIDETVLATIETWTFKPATKDGIPVPSEQEILFHYEHA
jgi:protein TonB